MVTDRFVPLVMGDLHVVADLNSDTILCQCPDGGNASFITSALNSTFTDPLHVPENIMQMLKDESDLTDEVAEPEVS